MWQKWTRKNVKSHILNAGQEYSLQVRNVTVICANALGGLVQSVAINSFSKIVSQLFKFFAALSGAVFGIFSVAILLFALTANGREFQPGSEPFADDNFLKFVENLTYTPNIKMMEAQGLNRGAAAFEPWSGSYWPIHKGILGIRYASKTFSDSKNFMTNYQNYQANPAENFIANGEISDLSPAEKYDLLVGDSNWTLTKHMWAKGLSDFEKDGGVAGWTGICHGWSAVTHMDGTSPYAPVTVLDATGRYNVTFHPNDIKGLLSWLWAASSPSSFRAGDRCRQGNVVKDVYLRPVEPSCLDSNPMSWHLAIVNRVGMNKKSMVMDSSNGPEVWNYPITGYDYDYFDPKTFAPTHSLNNAIRPVSELTSDVYRDFRSPKAVYIVGIIMDTYHPALTEPTVGITSRITTKRITFVYDLELDGDYNVVGGEWYGKDTPDFMWSYPAGSLAMTREDIRMRANSITWDAKSGVMPSEIASLARSASQRGEVLATISNSLLRASTRDQNNVTPPNDGGVADEDEIGSGNHSTQPTNPTPTPTPIP